MLGFFTAAMLLLLAAVGLVVYPLLGKRREQPAEEAGSSVIGLGRERLEALKEKRRDGEIDQAEYAEQVRDLETQLADDLHTAGGDTSRDRPGEGGHGGRWMVVPVVVLIPLLAGLLYLSLGRPQALIPENLSAVPAQVDADGQPVDVDAMVARLEQELENNPGNAEGWFMLGRSYMVLKRYAESAEAFRRLRELVGDEPNLMVREATARAMQQGGDLSGEPMRLVERVLEQEPDHSQALWLAATAAYQAGDRETALRRYRRVAPMLEGEEQRQVQGMIDELTAGGQPRETPPAADGAASLTVNVSLAPALRDRIEESAILFVFARAVDGPEIPLAVVKQDASELPATVTLDDSLAMMPALRLSLYDRVTVSARISQSGEAKARPGDLEGHSDPVSTDGPRDVELTIDRVLSASE